MLSPRESDAGVPPSVFFFFFFFFFFGGTYVSVSSSSDDKDCSEPLAPEWERSLALNIVQSCTVTGFARDDLSLSRRKTNTRHLAWHSITPLRLCTVPKRSCGPERWQGGRRRRWVTRRSTSTSTGQWRWSKFPDRARTAIMQRL